MYRLRVRVIAFLLALVFAFACDEAATPQSTPTAFPPIATRAPEPKAKPAPKPEPRTEVDKPQTTVRPTGLDTRGLPDEVRGVLAKIEARAGALAVDLRFRGGHAAVCHGGCSLSMGEGKGSRQTGMFMMSL